MKETQQEICKITGKVPENGKKVPVVPAVFWDNKWNKQNSVISKNFKHQIF